MTDSTSQLVKKSIVFSTEYPNLVFNLPETHPNKIMTLAINKEMETIRVLISNDFPEQNMLPTPALDCRCTLEFFTLEGKPRFYTFKASWTGLDSQQLSTLQHFYDGDWYEGLFRQTNMEKAIGPHDLFPGEECYVDIACRFTGETEGFVWMEKSYFHALAGKSPFVIKSEGCLVRLSVFGRNVSEYTVFKIINTEDEFKGVPATTEEIALLTHKSK
jgi:hypothetical protein